MERPAKSGLKPQQLDMQSAPPATINAEDQKRYAALTEAVSVLSDLDALPAWPAFVDRVGISYARRHRIVGLMREGRPHLVMGADTPSAVTATSIGSVAGWRALDVLRRWLGGEARFSGG